MADRSTAAPEDSLYPSSCSECHRRKQKCNRVWPCNHCQKRKIGDRCRFDRGFSSRAGPSRSSVASSPMLDPKRKREASTVLDDIHPYASDAEHSSSGDNGEEDGGFEALGYATSHLFASLTTDDESPKIPAAKEFLANVDTCPQLDRALRSLPPRTFMDDLVQNFVNNVNFHYYIIFPAKFLEEYQSWCSDRSEGKPLGLQWTSLLLMICACSIQYTNVQLQIKLERGLGETTQGLTEKYHAAARELHSIIPIGYNHIYNVQQLMHSCYWFKSEARYVECWHILSVAVREAQELKIHKDIDAESLTEFEKEMRRRVWCILDTWDWQISALLSRPMIIDRSDCDVQLPSLTLEDYSPSPMLHMVLQRQLINALSREFRLPKYVATPVQVEKYHLMVEKWMASFPPTHAFSATDTSRDKEHPWIRLHRHYLHTMAYSLAMDPSRSYLTVPMSRESAEADLSIRNRGIDYALKLMKTLYAFLNHIWPRDIKFHFVLFCIFDTAAVLCSALAHDQDCSILRRQEMLDAIESAVRMLRQLKTATKTAEVSFKVLLRLNEKVAPPLQFNKMLQSLGHRTATAGEASQTSNKRIKRTRKPLNTPNSANSPNAPVDRPSIADLNKISPLPSSPEGSTGVGTSLTLATSPKPRPGSRNTAFVPAFRDDTLAAEAPTFLATPPADSQLAEQAGQGPPSGQMDDLPGAESEAIPDLGFTTVSDQELGELASLWNWQSLDLDLNFLSQPIV